MTLWEIRWVRYVGEGEAESFAHPPLKYDAIGVYRRETPTDQWQWERDFGTIYEAECYINQNRALESVRREKRPMDPDL